MSERWRVDLYVRGRTSVFVYADTEAEACAKAEATDSWELEIEVVDVTADGAEIEE